MELIRNRKTYITWESTQEKMHPSLVIEGYSLVDTLQKDENNDFYKWYDLDLNPLLVDPTKTLEQVRESKLTEINTSYNNEISANINYMNTEFQADKDSRDLIVATLSGGSLPDGFFWQDLNDDRIPMTYIELQGLSTTILSRGQLAFIKLQDLKVLVNRAGITIEELGLIVW